MEIVLKILVKKIAQKSNFKATSMINVKKLINWPFQKIKKLLQSVQNVKKSNNVSKNVKIAKQNIA